MSQPLTDAINALTTYANEVTGKSDETLSDAVESLADGYGGGGSGGSEDNSILAKLLDRSIQEFIDDKGVVLSIGPHAMRGCDNLTKVKFPAATVVGNNAFYTCRKLIFADFFVASFINASAFYNCSKLSTLIIRKSDSVCSLSNTNALSGTEISSKTGYVYVPSSLVDTYKSASNWTSFSSQFRALEDYTVDGTITGELDPNKI